MRQHTLLSLGRVGDDGLDKLISAIGKHKDVLTAIDAAKSLDIEDTYTLGPLLAVQHIFTLFKIDRILCRIAEEHPQLEFDLCQIVFTMITCRFLRPSSKLKIFEKWQDRLYPEMLSGKGELQHFYRSLDLLNQHKEQIENELY